MGPTPLLEALRRPNREIGQEPHTRPSQALKTSQPSAPDARTTPRATIGVTDESPRKPPPLGVGRNRG